MVDVSIAPAGATGGLASDVVVATVGYADPAMSSAWAPAPMTPITVSSGRW